MTTPGKHGQPPGLPPVVYVDSDAALDDCLEAAAGARELALDTEFERSRTYYARLGLLQLGDGSTIWLVDPRARIDLDPVLGLLGDPALGKTLHSGSEDLELLGRLAGTPPGPIFDTQIAAGLAGLSPTLSYRDLVESLCGVELAKGETRSDWLARPLSDAQRHYAALDVAYLPAIRAQLLERLERQGRLDWLAEDCAQLVATACAPPDLERMYAEFKLAWKLDGPSRAVLRALLAWRESHAQRRDLPRRRVLDDDAVLELARQLPETEAEVARCASLGRRKRADVAATVLAVVTEARHQAPPPAPPPPLDREGRARLKALRPVVEARARDLGLDPQVLATRRDLQGLLQEGRLGGRLTGWRREVVGGALLAAVDAG